MTAARRWWAMIGMFGIMAWASVAAAIVPERDSIEVGAPVAALALSPDGKLLAWAAEISNEPQFVIYDLATKTRKTQLVKGGNVGDLAFSPDGKWLAAATKMDGLILRNIASEKSWLLAGQGSHADRKFRTWDVADQERGRGWPNGFQFVGNKTLVVFIDSHVVTLDLGSMEVKSAVPVKNKPTDANTVFAVAPNAKLIVWASEGGDVQVINAVTGDRQRVLEGVKGRAFAFSPDGQKLYAGLSGQIRNDKVTVVQVFDLSTGAKQKDVVWETSSSAGFASVRSIEVAPGGKVVATAAHGEAVVRLWYLDKDATASLSGHAQPGADGIVFSPDGKTCYAAGWDGTIKIRDVPAK